MSTSLVIVNDQPASLVQAETDERLVELWLHGRSSHTQRSYALAWRLLAQYVAKPLRAITLGDLQGFADALASGANGEGTRNRRLSAIKSLFAFAHRIGYLALDVGRPLRLPKCRETLSERILSEDEVSRILSSERQPRNRIMLELLYMSGVRVSELCGLRRKDLQERRGGGQITVYGKGGKTRSILLPNSTWIALMPLCDGSAPDEPVFKSRKGGSLDPSQVFRIVQSAAKRAGISKNVSCHWLRHAHASHALDHDAPLHLVQQTLGHSSVATTGLYLHARPSDSSSRYLPQSSVN